MMPNIETSMQELVALLQGMKTKDCPKALLEEISFFEGYIRRIAKVSEIVEGLPKIGKGIEFSPEVQARVYPLLVEATRMPIKVPLNLKMAFDKVVLSANFAIKSQKGFATFKESVAVFNKECAASIAANTGNIYKELYNKYKKKEISKSDFKKLRKDLRATLTQTKKLGMRWGKPGKKLYIETILGTVMTLKVLLVWSIFMSTVNSLLYGGIVTSIIGTSFGQFAIPAYFLGQIAYQYARGLAVIRGSLEALGRFKVYSIF